MNFLDHKRAAISFTFDDGSQEHFDLAVPLLNEFGFRGTFFVIAGLTRSRKSDPLAPDRRRDFWAQVSWEEWREAARSGHEIGNHSLTHPFLTRLGDPHQLRAEIAGSARLIEERIGQRPVSFACPYNKSSERVRRLVLQHHKAMREERVRYGGRHFTLEKANRLIDRAIRKGLWVVPMIHGIGGGFDPFDPDVFRRHLQYIKEREAEIWVEPFGSASRRIKPTSV